MFIITENNMWALETLFSLPIFIATSSIIVLVTWLATLVVACIRWNGSPTPTFSEMLATDRTVQALYLVIVSVYLMMTLFVGAIVTHDHLTRTARTSMRVAGTFRYAGVLYEFATDAAVVLALLSCVGLYLIFAYPVDTYHTQHLVFTAITFGCKVVSMLLFVCRRAVLIHFTRVNPEMFPMREIRYSRGMFWANVVYAMAVIAVTAVFGATRFGEVEFVLITLFLVDYLWIVPDLHKATLAIVFRFNNHSKVVCALQTQREVMIDAARKMALREEI